MNSIEKEAEADLANHQSREEQRKNDCKKSKKYSRLSCLRRRRHAQKVDESDLSEGFDSDSSQGSIKGSDGSESGSEKSDEEAEAAFDVETDSDMNSQESRSDLEDMEDEPGEEGSSRDKSGPREALKNCVDGSGLGDSKGPGVSKPEAPDPAVNGPASLSTNDTSIASNLQAMSTQLFQTKRCFRLAPTFSNILLKPSSELPALKDGMESKPCVNGDLEKPGLAEQGRDRPPPSENPSLQFCAENCRLQQAVGSNPPLHVVPVLHQPGLEQRVAQGLSRSWAGCFLKEDPCCQCLASRSVCTERRKHLQPAGVACCSAQQAKC